MNILVTGCNGYIGKHACDYFKKRNNYIIGVGRKTESTAYIDEYIVCDFAEDDVKGRLASVFEKGVDVVLHIAADNRHEPFGIDVIKSNCIGTQALLELCEEYESKVFVQLSSIPVIGEPKETPITVHNELEPPTIYHATKVLQELLADYAYRKNGLRTVSIRIPSPMGIGVNEHYIFPTFIRKAIVGEPIELYGHGTRKQTYVHVSDICDALNRTIESNCHGTYLLGSPHLISNADLAKLIVEVLKSESEVRFVDKPDVYDGQIWEIDYSPLTRDTGYNPKISLEEMILEYRDYLAEGMGK